MAINKTSPQQLSFKDDIEAEFGPNTGRTLGNYRLTQSVGQLNLPLDSGVPTSGQIKFSDFYGKKLNVVVNCYSTNAQNGGATEYRVNARTKKYNTNKVTVIGGFHAKKISGSKIIIHVNKKFGSDDNNNANRCALRTGNFNNAAAVQIDVGSNAKILGAGGKGGKGQNYSGNGSPGNTGSSGLGVSYNGAVVNVSNGAIIRAGFGGGGGGAGGRQVDKGEDRKASGAGGGGGQGFPGGAKGAPGIGAANTNTVSANDNATAGDEFGPGQGGTANQNASQAYGANGGEGGSVGQAADAGGNAQGTGGAGGSNGAAIRRGSGFSVTINNSGTIQGSTSATGVS
tara:strand:+ start:1443 stop:2468 length:1026 start_codon:yes stop_codon:yes gene_type:complete